MQNSNALNMSSPAMNFLSNLYEKTEGLISKKLDAVKNVDAEGLAKNLNALLAVQKMQNSLNMTQAQKVAQTNSVDDEFNRFMNDNADEIKNLETKQQTQQKL